MNSTGGGYGRIRVSSFSPDYQTWPLARSSTGGPPNPRPSWSGTARNSSRSSSAGTGARETQADYLAPEGYEVAYRTNAVTRQGEHGNALLSRWPLGDIGHHDVSDHRFEQRGLLHVEVDVQGRNVHVIVVHLGLIPGSRIRQIERLQAFIECEVPPGTPLVVAGDFNDWGQQIRHMLAGLGLLEYEEPRAFTYPARLPLAQLDHVYARGLTPVGLQVPRGRVWWRMSDHLPLIAEFRL